MSYAVVGILVIAFIAFVVLSAKAWHWSNIVFLCLTFLAAIGVVIATAQVMDLRYKAMKDAKRSKENVERVEAQIEEVVYGTGLSYEYAPDSLRGLSEALNLETAGRGRVWRSGTVEQKGANRVFKFSADRIQNQDNEAQAKMDDMQLFVYADLAIEDQLYPVRFVGIMGVVGETNNSIELEPIFIADNQEYQQPSLSWTMFEKSPADQRDAFIRDTDIELDLDAADFNERLSEYRKLLVETFMPADIFDLDLNNDEQARQYENMIDRVVFDGLPLLKIESWIESRDDRIAQRFDPSNEEVFVRFRFDDKSNRAYQVDSAGNIETDGQFTKNGQAVDPALHAGGEIEFQKGDEILVDQLTADGYQRGEERVSPFAATEPVTEISRTYVRQLKDFPFLLRTLQRQTAEYEAEAARIAENNRRSQLAIGDAGAQTNKRDEQIQKLREDQEKLQADVETVTQFLDDTKMLKNDLEKSIAQLEMDIREEHRKIKAMSRALDERSTSNVSESPVEGE